MFKRDSHESGIFHGKIVSSVLSHFQTENLGRGLSGRQIGSDVLILYPLLSSPNLRTLKDTFNRPNGPPVPPP